MACRTLANGAHRRPGSLPLHNFGRGVNNAAHDRYTTIRSFFSRQSASPNISSRQIHARTYVISVEKRHIISPRPFDTLFRKHFGASAATEKQRDKGYPDLGLPDKPPSSKETPSSTNGVPLDTATSKEAPSEIPHFTFEQSPSDTPPPPNPPEPPPSNPPPLNLDNYPRFFRRLALSLPHLHRPTRDDFLDVTNSFWQRIRIRFKWFTIKSFRKFNADDISAFVTWFLMSQTLWILVGT
jgi:distribution and morphology protein 31